MSVLEELWYGNLEPSEFFLSSSQEYKELLHLVSRNEEKLLSTMAQEQKELFSGYSDCVRKFQSLTELLLFQSSFKLGARMMAEMMTELHRTRARLRKGSPAPWYYGGIVGNLILNFQHGQVYI